jgi:hypothetical protein
MSGRTSTLIAAIVATSLSGLLLVATAGAEPAFASWSQNNCHGSSRPLGYWQRENAKVYVDPMDHEGYEWGGGCYRLNNRDDTRGAPDSGGEGADCSGFVFRVWALKGDGRSGQRWWDYDNEIHGPFDTGDYYSPLAREPFHRIAKGYPATKYMDAFVYRAGGSGHIGLIYDEEREGHDQVAEAKGDADGTVIMREFFRQDSRYRAVERDDWMPDCYPQCRGHSEPVPGREAA